MNKRIQKDEWIEGTNEGEGITMDGERRRGGRVLSPIQTITSVNIYPVEL